MNIDKIKNVFKHGKNFKYLDKLIHSGINEIVLDSDIILNDEEEFEYMEGIQLDVDDLVIDGSGYTIDAREKTRIFTCTGKNITIKNITLKNGFTEKNGGAIHNDGVKITIIKSSLNNNTAEWDGGAIYNSGDLTIINTTINNNVAMYNDGGGAIYNSGDLTITKSTLNNNNANPGIITFILDFKNELMNDADTKGSQECRGGAIHNEGELTITESTLTKNKSWGDGGAIYNLYGKVCIKESTLKENKSRGNAGAVSNASDLTIINSIINSNISKGLILLEPGMGGAIDNYGGECNIIGSTLNNNKARCNGGAIYNKQGKVSIIKSTLNNNKDKGILFGGIGLRHCGAIYNEDGLVKISESILNSNIGKGRFLFGDNGFCGGAIGNSGQMNISGSTLNNNKTKNNGGGAIFNENGDLEIKKSTPYENTAGNGRAICNNWGELTITESVLNNNKIKNNGGGAIINEGELTITESALNNNKIKNNGGGAIKNSGKLTISNSKFSSNMVKKNGGGAIINENELTIKESTLNENISQKGSGAIHNKVGKLNCLKCEISSNKSSKNIILNNDYSEFHNTNFRNNQSKCVILNEGGVSNIGIYYGEFKENNVNSVLHNNGKFCSIEKTILENNIANNSINNHGDLNLISPKIKDNKIQNKKYITIRNSSPELESKIYGEGKIEIVGQISEDIKFDFGYLDKKIHESNTNEIILEEDIYFENYEKDYYEGGIELDKDNLIIDGKGHTIDGADKSRIFLITGNNITLKNITFKNGHSHRNYNNPQNENGGSLKINSNINLSIENCKFANNISESSGGAISKREGDLTIIDSDLSNNQSTKNGGAIFNVEGFLNISNSVFNRNIAKKSIGGAIYNKQGKVSIIKSTLNNNISDGLYIRKSERYTGAVYSKGGGAIYNEKGNLTITESTLNNNSLKKGDGGAISNEKGNLTITESTLNENTADNGGAICNNWGELTITESTLNENIATQTDDGIIKSGARGGAIYNYWSDFTIIDSTLNNNIAEGKTLFLDDMGDGGAICNFASNRNIDNCKFKDNIPNDVVNKGAEL